MSGETEKNISGWTTDTLKEYIESLIEGLRTELISVKEAITTARQEMNRRLEDLNQLRGEVTDDREQFVRKEVYEPAHKEIVKSYNELSDKYIEMSAKVAGIAEAITGLKNQLSWLVRLILGAVILMVLAFGFRALTGRG